MTSGGASGLRVAVDVGGTFTDLVALMTDGRVRTAKVPTTPPNFDEGVITSLKASGLAACDAIHFVHGTTVVINALTERKGARVGLLVTAGFRDVLSIGRGNRPDMYNLRFRKETPFVPRSRIAEVDERLDADGTVHRPLNLDSLDRAIEELSASEVEAVGICFLHSYANPDHERRAAERVRSLHPEWGVTCSHEITREWREYERMNTTALNAYVQPVADGYLERLARRLHDLGLRAVPQVMKSDGGVLSFDAARTFPIHLIESGPAAGVIGAAVWGRRMGEENLLTLDIGGTTAKSALVRGGSWMETTDYRLEKSAARPGYPIKVPTVDIVEIGAGGGSIAWLDGGGALQVGPRSAGALPGPACYGRGGREPTVTDAHLLLGRLNPKSFLGGRSRLDVDRAREAFDTIASRLAMSPEEAALGTIRLVNVKMANLLRLVTVQKGLDPRDFTLVAYGGGGGLHAAALAKELRLKRVIVPPLPGHFSAWGMLMAEPSATVVRTVVREVSGAGMAAVAAEYADMAAHVVEELAREGFDRSAVRLARAADLRYKGQEHTVRVSVGEPDDAWAIRERFHAAHRERYTFQLDSPIEWVNLYVTGTVPRADLVSAPQVLPGVRGSDGGAETAESVQAPARPVATRLVLFEDEGWLPTAIYDRTLLSAGSRLEGPAIVEEEASSTVVLPGQCLLVRSDGCLSVEAVA